MSRSKELSDLPASHQELLSFFGMDHIPNSFDLFSGRGNQPLAKRIASLLDVPYHPNSVKEFLDGEIDTTLPGPARGKEVIIFNSLWHPSIKPAVLKEETVAMSSAARQADASRVSVIMPYFPGRKDRKDKPRTNIGAAETLVQLVEAGGAQRLLTMDIHAEQTISAVVYKHVPFDLTYGSRVLVPAIRALGLNEPTIVAPDVGAVRRGNKFKELLGYDDLAIVIKNRDLHSGGTDTIGFVGDVGENAIIIDDEISTGGTMWKAAEQIKERSKGRGKVIAVATHGKFVPDSSSISLPERILQPGSPIDRIIVTDTIFQRKDVRDNPKVEIISTAPIFAIAIMCWLLNNESLGNRLSMSGKQIY